MNERNASLARYTVGSGITNNSTWFSVDIGELQTFSISNGDYVRVWFQPRFGSGGSGGNSDLKYTFDSSTSNSDPGSGRLRLNNSTLSSATQLYISETDANGVNVSAILATWDDKKIREKGWVKITKASDPSTWVQYQIILDLTDNGTWDTFRLNYVGHNGTFANDDSVVLSFTPDPGVVFPKNYRTGLLWGRAASDAANHVNVYTGACRDDTDTDNIVLNSFNPLVKSLASTWAAGNNAGGLDTGTRANNTWYWIWAIKNPITGDTDALLSTSATSPTLPSGYTLKRRVGAIKTLASQLQSIYTFPSGDQGIIYIMFLDPAQNGLDVSVTNLGTTRTTYTLSNVPAFGSADNLIIIDANVGVNNGTSDTRVYISTPLHVNSAPSATAAPLSTIKVDTGGIMQAARCSLYVDNNAQIAARSTASNTTLSIQILGWLWTDKIF
jgi:hypothetical protein